MSKTHGQYRSSEYGSWESMRGRCLNENATGFGRYGERFVCIYTPWLRFENFIADMGAKPPGTTLERKDNDGDYAPWNCKWATYREQARNRKNNHTLTYLGRKMTVTEVSEISGVPMTTLLRRLASGESPESATEKRIRNRWINRR